MPTLHIHFLGEFRLLYGETPITALHQTRQQALLAYLVLHTVAPQPRQQLAFRFWPDSSEAQAFTNLRKQLLFLRRTLPAVDTFLHADAKVVQWQPDAPFTLDVAAFEQALAHATTLTGAAAIAALQGAIALYRGDLLPGCYDDWLIAKREALRAQYSQALARLGLLLEDQRDHPAAIQVGQQLLRHDPLQETSYQQLMRRHALNGDRAAALQVYHTCVTILQRELAVEPSADTCTAYERLLHQDRPVDTSQPRSALTLAQPALVGRQVEWARLQEIWRRVIRGQAHLVVMSGEAGIGKTRLGEELLRSAESQNILTAHTRTYAAEGGLAYAPLIEWLRTPSLKIRLAQLDTPWLTELARLLPELLTEHASLPAPNAITESWQRHRLFEALARALLAGQHPLLLMLDDVQWCDQETLAWLHFLLRSAPHARLLIVCTVRTEALDTAVLTTWLAELRRSAQVTVLALGPLNEQETMTLAGQVAGDALAPALAAAFYQATEGNPLFVVEMLRAGFSLDGKQSAQRVPFAAPPLPPAASPPLPEKVQAVLQTRLAQLSPGARELARLAATIGRVFPLALLVEAGAGDEETVVQALDELWQQRLVREQTSACYDFSHDKLREVAYAELSPVRRRHLHRRIAQALERLHAATLDPVSGQIAAHYEQAGLPEPAIAYYRQAAGVARQLYANQEVIQQLERALQLLRSLPNTPDQQQQELELQVALATAFMDTQGLASADAEQAYQRAFALGQQAKKTAALFPILWGLHEVYLFQAKHEQARTLAAQCMDIAERLQERTFLLQAHHAWWAVLSLNELPAALAHAEAGLALYDPLQDHAQAALYGGHDPGICGLLHSADARWLLGYPAQAQARAQEALQLGYQLAHPFSLALALNNVATLQAFRRESAPVIELTQTASTIATERKLPALLAEAMILQGWAFTMQGNAERGLVQLQQSLAAWCTLGIVLRHAYHLLLLAEAYAQVGQLQAAVVAIAEALAAAQTSGERAWTAEIHRLQGQLLLATGQPINQAERAYQQALVLAREQQAKTLELRVAVSLSRLWQQQGKRTEAQQLLASIYAWFTEGFDTVDLQAAQALLRELA